MVKMAPSLSLAYPYPHSLPVTFLITTVGGVGMRLSLHNVIIFLFLCTVAQPGQSRLQFLPLVAEENKPSYFLCKLGGAFCLSLVCSSLKAYESQSSLFLIPILFLFAFPNAQM